MTTFKASARRVAGAVVIGLGLLFVGGLNAGQAIADKIPQMCPNDLDPFPELSEVMNPCITELTQNGSVLHVAWDGLQDRAYYEISWQITPPGQRPGQDTFTEPVHRVGGARLGRSTSRMCNRARPIGSSCWAAVLASSPTVRASCPP